MAKTKVKEFNIFCHIDEAGEVVNHKVTIDKKGSVCLHGHPELQSEVYYHLLMVQKEKADPQNLRYSYRGYAYPVSGCLQFYFSLIHKKFEQHLKNITFETKDKDHVMYSRGDNERIEHYLEKVREKTAGRQPFDREQFWSEKAFERNHKEYLRYNLNRIVNEAFSTGVERFPRYIISIAVAVGKSIPNIEAPGNRTDQYSFRSHLDTRCSSSRTSYRGKKYTNKGTIGISLTITKDWFKDVYRKKLSSITTDKHGKMFVLSAEETGVADRYLVDAVVPGAGTRKHYTVQTFLLTKNIVTDAWMAQRKNKKRSKTTVTVRTAADIEKEEAEEDLTF